MSTEPEHDYSRVDSYLRSRQRVAFLHAIWRPMLAGGAGAAIIIAAVAIAQPRFTTREVVVDRVIPHDVPLNNPVPHDVPFNNPVPRDVPFDVPVPRVVTAPPVASSPAPKTPEEHKFVSRPEYESAQFKGRLVEDKDGQIRFDTGAVFVPIKIDPASGRAVQDYDAEYVTEPYWGDLAFCNAIPAVENRFKCLAIHHDVIVDLTTTYRPKRPTALHERREVPIRQVPIVARQSRPT
jgi:hypothetical protein